ncbi:MAG: type IIL restriction-modification enzyme MmeI [Dehalococcoidia bacterium]|nr:type IIL restriction-modification enzyme MmeI [Dehalococcoidia bacterium]
MDVQTFAAKWKAAQGAEMREYQDHFRDLCALVDHPPPNDQFFDPQGDRFTYQKRTEKVAGGNGWADVWYKGHFAVEYKSKGEDLDAAYAQLLRYRDNLDNPPLLIVCDFENLIVRTNYTGHTTRVVRLTLDDFAKGAPIPGIGLATYRRPSPLLPRPGVAEARRDDRTPDGRRGEVLRTRRPDAARPAGASNTVTVARFISKLVFSMFASDVGLLPPNVISRLVDNYGEQPGPPTALASALGALFETMRVGGDYGADPVPHFNGGLFDDPDALAIDSDTMRDLRIADGFNWADVGPSVYGTLFERIIDERQAVPSWASTTRRARTSKPLSNPLSSAPLQDEWKVERPAVSTTCWRPRDPQDEAARQRGVAAAGRAASNASPRCASLDPACRQRQLPLYRPRKAEAAGRRRSAAVR